MSAYSLPSPTPFDAIGPDHFRDDLTHEAIQAMFLRSVEMVEIETFSYCNRRCWFCPNSIIDRISENREMPESLYLTLLDQLAGIGYQRMLSFSRYNEPLSDRLILRRIAQAHERLPHAHLHTNTNGDYLTRDYVHDLQDAGLRSLNIQIYLKNEERYDHARIRERMDVLIEKFGLPARVVIDQEGEWLEAALEQPGMTIRLYGRNFASNGCSRGDSIDVRRDHVRIAPCLSPFHHVYIDYNGKVMPCCNLRSDLPSHGGAVIASLADDPDLFRAYGGTTAVRWRRALAGYGPKHGFCATCAFPPPADTPANREATGRLTDWIRQATTGN